jgi:hypothetical protein
MNPTPGKDSYGTLFRIIGASAVLALLGILCVSIWQPSGLSDQNRQVIAWAAGGIVLGVVLTGLYLSWLGQRNRMHSPSTTRRPPLVIVIVIIGAVSPWLGIAASVLAARTWMIAYIGVVLWSANCAGLWYLHRMPDMKGKKSLGISLLVWTLTFVPLFAATAAATSLILSRHSAGTVP